MWTCPECKKQFRNKEQWHSCINLSIDEHLTNKDENIVKVVRNIINFTKTLPAVEINPVKSSIEVKAGATFLSIRAKKNYAELEFQLTRLVDEFPIEKAIQISGNRYLHVIKIDSPANIDHQLLKWIEESYKLVLGKK